MDKLSTNLGRSAGTPLAFHYTFLRNSFSTTALSPGQASASGNKPSHHWVLECAKPVGQTWLGTFSWLPSSPPPLNCRNISQRRYRRLEQTGCEEVLALGAWQEHEPGHPGVWGLTAPSHSLEPTDTSNMSFLSSCLRRKCSWITLTRGEERRSCR